MRTSLPFSLLQPTPKFLQVFANRLYFLSVRPIQPYDDIPVVSLPCYLSLWFDKTLEKPWDKYEKCKLQAKQKHFKRASNIHSPNIAIIKDSFNQAMANGADEWLLEQTL